MKQIILNICHIDTINFFLCLYFLNFILITVKSMDISSTEINFLWLSIKNMRSNVKLLRITALGEQSGS